LSRLEPYAAKVSSTVPRGGGGRKAILSPDQLKQTLQLADFLGTSANAIRWQIWIALLIYLLLRYMAYLSEWAHSFSRLFAILRTSLWRKWHLLSLLQRYGTAGGHFRYLSHPEQAYFPGFP
jgi:hypothetical protein